VSSPWRRVPVLCSTLLTCERTVSCVTPIESAVSMSDFRQVVIARDGSLPGSIRTVPAVCEKFARSLLFREFWPCRPQDGPNAETPGIAEVHLATSVLEDEGGFGISEPIVRTYPSIHELHPARLTRIRSLRFFRFDLLCETSKPKSPGWLLPQWPKWCCPISPDYALSTTSNPVKPRQTAI
jgi:hypothetical protein